MDEERDNSSVFPLSRRWLLVLAAATIALAAGAAFSNVLHGTWGLDDYSSIVENDVVHLEKLTLEGVWTAATSSPEADRPVTNATFALNYYLHGSDPKGYKLINLFVHVLNVLGLFFFLYLFLRTLFRTRSAAADGPERRGSEIDRDALEIAWITALLWGVHPVLTQTVNYVVQRSVMLSGMFYLWGLWSYLEGRSRAGWRRWGFYGLTGGLYLLSMASKEIGATLPLAILLMEWVMPDRDGRKRGRLSVWGGGLLITFLVVAVMMLGGVEGVTRRVKEIYEGTRFDNRRFTLVERVMTQWRVVLFYLSLVFYPGLDRLNLEHEFQVSTGLFSPASTMASLLCLLVLLWIAIRVRRDEPLVSFGLFWFFLQLAITSTVLNLELAFEHRVYLASAGPVLVVVMLFVRFLSYSFRIRCAWVLIFALLLGWGSYQRNQVWYDQVRLYKDAVQKAPGKPRNQGNLGVAYYRRARDMLARGRESEKAFSLLFKAVDLHVKTLRMRAEQKRPIDPVFSRNLDDLLVRLEQVWLGLQNRESAPEFTRQVVEAFDRVLYDIRPGQVQRRGMLIERLIQLRITYMTQQRKLDRPDQFRYARTKLRQLIRLEPDRAREVLNSLRDPERRERFKEILRSALDDEEE